KKLQKNIALLGADRFANADLARPLGDRDQHNIHDTYTADHQAHRRDDDHRQKHPARDRFELIDQAGGRLHRKVVLLAELYLTPNSQKVLDVVLCLFKLAFLGDGQDKKVVGLRLDLECGAHRHVDDVGLVVVSAPAAKEL